MAQARKVFKLKDWFLNCWNNYPGVVASSFLPVLCLPAVVYKYYYKKSQGGFSNKYLMGPVVVRPGDPRINKVLKTHELDD